MIYAESISHGLAMLYGVENIKDLPPDDLVGTVRFVRNQNAVFVKHAIGWSKFGRYDDSPALKVKRKRFPLRKYLDLL